MTSASSSLRNRAASELRSAAANLTGVKGAFMGARVEYPNDLIWHAARRPPLPPDPGTHQRTGPRPAGDRFPDHGPPRAGIRGSELFVADVGIAPPLGAEQSGEIVREIVSVLAEFLAEDPEADEILRGRTFAREIG